MKSKIILNGDAYNLHYSKVFDCIIIDQVVVCGEIRVRDIGLVRDDGGMLVGLDLLHDSYFNPQDYYPKRILLEIEVILRKVQRCLV